MEKWEMKKKIVVFLLMICSFWGLFACGSDPYANMTMTIYYNGKEVTDGQVIDLNIETSSDGYDEASLRVEINGIDYDYDSSITVSGGEDYVFTTTEYNKILGTTSVTVRTISPYRTGGFALKINTTAGKISREINFNVNLALEAFGFKENAIKAIAKGSSVSLDDINGLFNFEPVNANQRDISIELATLVESTENAGFVVDGWNKSYSGIYSYIDDGQQYATVSNGVLTTFDTYRAIGGEDKKINYPTWTPSASAEGGNNSKEVVILKASCYSSKYNDYLTDFLEIPVIEVYDEDDIEVLMNTVNGNGEEFEITKSESGTYDVVMLDGSDMSVKDKKDNAYCFERQLSFRIFDEVDDDYFEDFKIVTKKSQKDNVIEIKASNGCETNEEGVMDVYPSAGVVDFNVLAKSPGTYTHEFVIAHKDSTYAGIFDKTIVVSFVVKDLPDDIKIYNKNTLLNDKNNPQSITIYDYYEGAHGEKIDVAINNEVGDYKYLVLTQDFDYLDSLELYSTKSNDRKVLANLSDGVLSSAEEGKEFTLFGSNDSFYIKHSLETLATKSVVIYIGVQVSMYADSYVGGEEYFKELLYVQPITVNFAIGLRSFKFDSNKIYVDLTDGQNLSKDNNEGVVLCELPEGQTMESCLNLSKCKYNGELITLVGSEPSQENSKVSIMIKCNSLRKQGSTTVELVASNGVTGSVTVYTYMPTIYKEYTSENKIPLAMTAVRSDGGYLYSVSGYTTSPASTKEDIYKDYASHDEKLVLGVNENELAYNSIHTLFGLVSKSVRLNFYDYLDLGNGEFEEYDITNKVKVSFKDAIGYASYDDGVLTFHQIVTDYERPLEMVVTYTGGYTGLGEDGQDEYKEVTIEHVVYIYVYRSMVGVEVETGAEGDDLYILDSLGYFDQALASGTVSARFSPSEKELGYEWNEIFGNGSEKLLFGYFCSMLNSPITDNGKQVEFYPNNTGEVYKLKYSDLFEIGESQKNNLGSYTCDVKCRLSSDLKDWINDNYGVGTLSEKIEQFLTNCIYGKNYTISIIISASQFGKLSNSTSVSYVCKFAPKISSIKLSVNGITLEDDGIYFDKRDVLSGSVKPVEIEYTIDTTACLNKDVLVLGVNTTHFSVETEYVSGNTGKIIITPNSYMKSGGLYDGDTALKIVLKDNVYNYQTGNVDKYGYSYYTSSLNQSIRIKIADGSEEFPFEIRSSSDILKMQNDIKNRDYNYYVLAKDIDASEISNYDVVDIAEAGTIFSLDGNHTYYRNGDKIELYNTIYNLQISRDISNLKGDICVGLFGKINSSAYISNLRLENVNISITTSANNNGSNNIYVGGIAGRMEGAHLNSVAVSGKITIEASIENSKLYVGGLVGQDYYNGTDSGEIAERAKSTSNLSSVKDNVNMEIELNGLVNSAYVGGVIGKLDHANVDTLQVVVNIKSAMKIVAGEGNIGGAIGISSSSEINNLEVSPVVAITGGQGTTENVGGIIGKLAGGKLTNSRVYFVNVGDVDSYLERLNIRVYGIGNANIGGIAGLISGSAQMGYNYARSFYSNDIEKNVYVGNILVSDIENIANVGGIAGLVETTGDIDSSYFDGDICISAEKTSETTVQSNIKAGVLFGNITSGKVNNSYAIGKLYHSFDNGNYAQATNYGYANGIVGGATYVQREITIKIGNGYSVSYPLVHEFNSDAKFSNVYAVVNSAPVFVAFESVAIMGETAGDLISKVNSANVLIGLLGIDTPIRLFQLLGYGITNGGKADENDVVSNYKWFTNEKIYKIDGYNYPILLTKTGNAMYDLVPSGIGIRFNSSINNIYDISYIETDDDNNEIKHNQLIMFMKKKSDGTYSKDYYEILTKSVSGSDKVAVVVEFNGEKIATDLVTIPFNDKIEIRLASSNTNNVIKLQGNKIYPLNEGTATIEIRSYLDKAIKTTFDITVVSYLDGIKLSEYIEDRVEEVVAIKGNRTVYIDEVSNFVISPVSREGYITTKQVGYILELLDSGSENGSIKINNVTYSFVEGGKNVFMLDGDQVLSIAGETIGFVKIKMTPYIKLGATKYLDNSYSGVSTTENIFILNKTGMNVSQIYTFQSLSRAIATSVSVSTTSISYNSAVSFTASIETSNVILNGENYEVLEDVYINLARLLEGIKFNDVNLKVIELTQIKNYKDFGNKYYFETPYKFEHKLIVLSVDGFTIERTTVNPENKKNTYSIILSMTLSFNSDFYRLNASSNEYDLNSIKFRVDVIPTSNMEYIEGAPCDVVNQDIVGLVEIGITPIGLTDIFMNYYSRGEGLLENTENTYPNDNESNRIVPGREGLLKITLNEEFSNSSYVTVTLDNKYGGYVRIEQMAGVLESLEDVAQFNTYEELLYNEPYNTSDAYGIKLQKLSCNLETQTYFDGTYYVKVTLLDRGVDYDRIFGENATIDIVVTSYTIDSYGNITETLGQDEPSRVKKLTITPLPSLSVQVNGSNNIYMGVGTKKPLTINYSHLTNNLVYDISPVDGNEIYIIDDSGERVNSLSLDYIDEGRIYYIAMDVETTKGTMFTLDIYAHEYVEGILEKTQSQIVINAVAYEVKDVSLMYSTYDEEGQQTILSIDHGESKIIKLNIAYEDIVIGTKAEMDAYKAMLDTYFKKGGASIDEFSPKQKVEYALSGTKVTHTVGNTETVVVDNALELYKITYVNGQKNFEQLTALGVYGGVDILNDSYISMLADGSIIEVQYTLLRGLSVSTDTYLRISVPYHYLDGDVVAGASSGGVYYEKSVEFKVVITENSSEDHPTPIENEADLKKYAGLTGHYILVNNIELTGWAPIPATFDSLDGNGYTIIIKSFNMASVRSSDTVNAGIFTEISETTLIKNLTIDVSHLLVNGTDMANDIKVVQNSKSSTYIHDQAGKIDLTFVKSVNFGVLAGVNNGSLTNIKVVNARGFGGGYDKPESKYLHVLTSLIDEEENSTTANIGGIVGVNSNTGAISNSFVGVNISEQSTDSLGVSHYYIKTVANPNSIEYNNDGDEMGDMEIYPFVLAGSNGLAGVAVENSGIISNTYIKGLGLYNASPNEESSVTAGLVGVNNNKITSSFAEGAQIENYRDTGSDDIVIEAIGNVAGLVYTNSGFIENAYANVYLQTNSSAIAGFVFTNTGTVTNAYSTAIRRNNWAYGPFTGVINRVAQNTGTYNNCFYLVGENEAYNDIEVATPMYISYFTETASMSLKDFWNGFSFVSAPSENLDDGIWTIVDGLPTIATTQIDTNSFRTLSESTSEYDEEGIVKYTRYSYIFDSAYQEGSVGNPLIIESASKFAPKIIAKSNKETKTFGGYSANDILGQLSAVEYVRLVNNLDFDGILVSNPSSGYSLYEITFAGKFDGNGMTMDNLKISTTKSQLENFGLFKQIGSTATTAQSVIKNLNIGLTGFTSNNNNKVGVLAGTIINATIANVNIDGNGESIIGMNMAGGLAGLIYAYGDNSVSIVDVEISNVIVQASHGSIGGTIEGIAVSTEDQSYGRYDTFNIYNTEKNTSEERSFTHLQTVTDDDGILRVSNTSAISYAGAVAGAVIANNCDGLSELNDEDRKDINSYRSSTNPSIYNIRVNGSITVGHADYAGGLFGYLSANSRIKNCNFELGANQTIVAWNFAGGIVAENYGIIEQAFVSYDKATQSTYDETIGSEDKDRDNGMESLFANSYSVSVGGIAGYSSGGAIVDSFSKVNVVEPLAFVAGGLVGYSYRYNYIGYSYTTGAVYGRDVMGGVVGLQISENDKISDKLYLDTVVGLNNWLNNIEDINSILYSGYKGLYTNSSGGYNNFYLKMPEVGNQELLLTPGLMDYYNINVASVKTSLLNGINLGEGQSENDYLSDKLDDLLSKVNPEVSEYLNSLSGTEEEILEGKLKVYYYIQNISSINDSYKATKVTDGNKIFVGSVVGASYIYEDANPENNAGRELFLNKDSIAQLYGDNLNHVFSSTYGIYQTQGGSLESGNKNDTYYGTDGSYRISYVNSDNLFNVCTLNFDSGYLDKLNFAKIFTSQEYTEQLIGTFYRTETAGQMSSTHNVFTGYSAEDRYSVTGLEETFVVRGGDSSQSIWDVKDVDNDYLPFINSGSIVSVEHLYAETDANRLASIFTSNTGNATYYLHVGNEAGTSSKTDFTIDITDTASINYMSTLRAVFIGVEGENELRPKIVFNIKEESTVSSIFNSMNGAVFSGVDFEINIYSDNLTSSNKEFVNFGILANSIESTLFDDCSIAINYEQNIMLGLEKDGIYNATNNGLIFGLVSNSTIKGSKVKFGCDTIQLNNSNIKNFGLLAGVVYSSTISDVEFDIISDKIEISVSNVSDNVSVGMVGYLQGSNYIRNKSNKIILINHNSSSSIYGSSSLGYVYNSTVNLEGVSSFTRLIYSNNSSGSNVYLGAIAGGSQGARFVAIELETTTTDAILTTEGNYESNEMSVGAIVGIDSASVFGVASGATIIGSSANIDISSKAKTLCVGGLIGKVSGQTKIYNAYSNGKVEAQNMSVGSETTGDKTVITYANTYVGGFVGSAKGSISMTSLLTSGDILVKDIGATYTNLALGGVVGYASHSCTISKFTVISDIEVDDKVCDKISIGYASQVVGCNEGTFSASDGYTYSELIGISDKFTTSAITNTRINSVSNVFYAREFAGNSYTSDSKFNAYAYADIYDEINEFSDFYKLSKETLTARLSVSLKDSGGRTEKSNVELPVVSALKDVVVLKISSIASLSTGFSRFYLKEVNSLNGYSKANYVAITEDVEINHIDELKKGEYISGRTTSNGKVIVTLGYSYNAKDYGNLVGKNSGVISNIYLRSSKEYDGEVYPLNVSLVGTNNGLITGVYVYERTQSQFGIANINNGTICGSATATVYLGETNKVEVYGLVETNNGLIADCYSSSVGYWENSSTKGQVYMVKSNNGTITNSFYYIPDVINYFNVQRGICAETSSSSQISNCSSVQNSKSILSRSNIWTTENDHAQLKGIKDIENAMVVHLYFGQDIGHQTEIENVEAVKGAMTSKSGLTSTYVFTWKIKFYETKEQVPVYNVIRIMDGDALVKYINSLRNEDSLQDAIIPNNTIVAIFEDIQLSSLPAFSISSGAMVIGIYHVEKVSGIDVKNTTSTITFKSELNHALIINNEGILCNIVFNQLAIKYEGQSDAFAPIDTNSGVINNIEFRKLTVEALGVSHVAGAVCKNEKNAVVYKIRLSDINLDSGYSYIRYIYNNKGTASGCLLTGSNNFNGLWLCIKNGVYN